MTERTTNLFLFLLGVHLPVWNLPADLLAGALPDRTLRSDRALNLLLSGTVFMFAFHWSQASLLDSRRRSRRE